MKHLWFIMDWNRRWAKENWVSTVSWHRAWWKNLENILDFAIKKGIPYVSAWALSSDNFKKRSKVEILWIFWLLTAYKQIISQEIYNKIKVKFIWDIAWLPKSIQSVISKIEDETQNNTGLTFLCAFNYWWKDEIVRWIKKFIQEWWDVSLLDEDSFTKYLDFWEFPPCDVIVRTWWDIRHSWYSLYNSSYSEYYFSDKRWPDFSLDDVEKVLEFYNNSKRNFWK